MIQINLLDQGAAKGPRAARRAGGGGGSFGSVAVALLALAVVAGDGGVGWTLYQKVHQAGEEPRLLGVQIAEVEARIAERIKSSEQVRTFQEVLNNQREVLRTLDPEDRILWSEKVNMIAALVPRDVFLSGIDVNEVVDMVETEASRTAHEAWEKKEARERGPEPKPVFAPVLHYDVSLTGLATGQDSVAQFDNVLAFHKAMIGYEMTAPDGQKRRFMDGFVNNVDFGSIAATTYEGVPVNEFVFKLRTINAPEKFNPPAPPAVAGPAAPADPELASR